MRMVSTAVRLWKVITVVVMNVMLVSAQGTASANSSVCPDSGPRHSCLVEAPIIAITCIGAVLVGFILGILARCYMEKRGRGESNTHAQSNQQRAPGSRGNNAPNQLMGTPPRTRQYVDTNQMYGPVAGANGNVPQNKQKGTSPGTMEFGVPKQRNDQVLASKVYAVPNEQKESFPGAPEYVSPYSKSPGDQYTSIDLAKSPYAAFTTGTDGYMTPISKNSK